MRGRKPKPTALKVLEGKTGSVMNNREPLPEKGLVSSPDWLTPNQKASWDYWIDNAPKNLLTSIDKNVLTVYVVAEDIHRQAVEAIREAGLIVPSPVKGEPMQNPWLAILNKQALILLKAGAELGFSPSSRSRVSIDPIDVESDNHFAQFNRR